MPAERPRVGRKSVPSSDSRRVTPCRTAFAVTAQRTASRSTRDLRAVVSACPAVQARPGVGRALRRPLFSASAVPSFCAVWCAKTQAAGRSKRLDRLGSFTIAVQESARCGEDHARVLLVEPQPAKNTDWHIACGNCGKCHLTFTSGARDSRAVPTSRRTTSSWMCRRLDHLGDRHRFVGGMALRARAGAEIDDLDAVVGVVAAVADAGGVEELHLAAGPRP